MVRISLSSPVSRLRRGGCAGENKPNKCFEMENLIISPPTSFVCPFIAAKLECRGADV